MPSTFFRSGIIKLLILSSGLPSAVVAHGMTAADQQTALAGGNLE